MTPSVEVAADPTAETAGDALRRLVRDVPDFPQPGVLFKDIGPVLADPAGFRTVVDELAAGARAEAVTKVVGIEARGFLLAAPVALAAGAGFVPVRKAGKLPGPVDREEYVLEYGVAAMEIQCGSVQAGERVLVIDDVLATGGTAAAARALITRAGGDAVRLAVLLEIAALDGRQRLDGLPVTSLLTV